jgi:hypothetical protein
VFDKRVPRRIFRPKRDEEVETWWKKARDINIWGRIVKEAKVHKGL